jgi:CRP-like cAMP-binding protein|tara:strand:- start:71 stop:724 length:654 start_codon:yes stop_codon:yes gene_type:complete
MDSNYVWVMGHLAFFLTAVSFLLKDIIFLRTIAVVSSLVGVGYNYLALGGPNWLPIFWLSIFTLINAFRIIGILKEKLSINFSDEEKELFETVFSDFNPVEFMKLFRVAQWKSIAAGSVIAKEGEPLDGVYMLYNGEVSVKRSGTEIGRPRDGALIGEMSFIQGENTPASATVICTKTCRCVFWPKAELRALLRRNPAIDVSLKHVFSVDLAKKLQT